MSKLISKDDLQHALNVALGNHGEEEEEKESEEEKPQGNTTESVTDEKEQSENTDENEISKKLEIEKLLSEVTVKVVDEKEGVVEDNTLPTSKKIPTELSLDYWTLPTSKTEKHKIPNTPPDNISLNTTSSTEFSLDTFLENVLSKLEIPVSVSFINTFLCRNKHLPISESFLNNKENRDKFSFFLLGCDFKINLKEQTSNCVSNSNTYENDLYENIHKDITSLQELEDSFFLKQLDEVLYTDFINGYSSHKYKRNLPFIVRNSHALKIEKKNENTYIRYIKEDEQVTRMWDIEKGFEALLFICMKELLSHFTTPVPLGILQNCFNFGHDCVINKMFLNKYHEVFEWNVKTTGIKMKGFGTFSRTTAATTSTYPRYLQYKQKSSSVTPTDDCKHIPEKTEWKAKENRDIADIAVSEKCSIVVIGDDESAPVVYYNEGNYLDRLAALEKLNKFIDLEIEKLSSR